MKQWLKGEKERCKNMLGGGGHGAPLWLLLTCRPPSSSSHTLSPPSSHPPEEHSDVWIVFSSRLLFPCQACARVQESLCRWWVWLCPCISLCQRPRKGRPEGVVLHFYSFINSPLRSDCGCQIGQNGRRDKAGSGGTGWQLNAWECFYYIVNNNVCDV